MYRYDEFDQDFVTRARRAVPRPGRAARFRRADRGPVQAAPADERRLPPAPRLHAAHRHPLRHAVPAPDAHARPHRAQIRPRLRPFHHAPEPAVPLAGAEGHPRHPRAPRQRSRCTPSRPRATASATSPPTTSPAPPPTRSPTRAPMRRSSASGRRCIPEFIFLPRKFKIAVTGAERDRAAIQVHDIGLHLKRNAAGELGFAVYVGGGLGRTPMIAPQDPRLPARGGPALLHRGDPARLQSVRPARQQVQGAHQDPRARDRRRGDSPARSRRSGSASALARSRCPRTRSAASRAISRCPAFSRGRRRASCSSGRARSMPVSKPGSRRTSIPHRIPATPRHGLAEADRRHARRRHRRPDGPDRRSRRAL